MHAVMSCQLHQHHDCNPPGRAQPEEIRNRVSDPSSDPSTTSVLLLLRLQVLLCSQHNSNNCALSVFVAPIHRWLDGWVDECRYEPTWPVGDQDIHPESLLPATSGFEQLPEDNGQYISCYSTVACVAGWLAGWLAGCLPARPPGFVLVYTCYICSLRCAHASSVQYTSHAILLVYHYHTAPS